MNHSLKNALLNFITAIFIFLFGYTAINKLTNRLVFENILRESSLINPYASVLVYALPAAELLAVGLLLFRKTRSAGLYCSLFLMAVFTSYVTYMLLFAGTLPWSCGGVLEQLSWRQQLWLNIFLNLLLVLGIYWQWQKQTNSFYPYQSKIEF